MKKGFTLIELLVVVAIIGVLATIVLASLGTARTNAGDAAIKQALTSMRTQAELQITSNGRYDDVCDAGTVAGDMWRAALENARTSTDPSARSKCIDSFGHEESFNGGITVLSYNSNINTQPDPNGNLWAAAVALKNGNFFCVDSSGAAIETTTIPLDPGGEDRTCD